MERKNKKNIPCLGLPLNRDIKMTLTFPEPQRPGKTWDLHLIVRGCRGRAGREFSLEWGIGAAESTPLSIPSRLLPGDARRERSLLGPRAVTVNVCSFMGSTGF